MGLTIHIVADRKHIRECIDNYLSGLNHIQKQHVTIYQGRGMMTIGSHEYRFLVDDGAIISKTQGLMIDELIVDDRVNLSNTDRKYLYTRVNRY